MSHMEWKNDSIVKARGGYARLLAVSCATCGTHLVLYNLKRMGLVSSKDCIWRDYSKDTGLLQAARASCKVWRVWWRPAAWASRHMSSAKRALIWACVRTR